MTRSKERHGNCLENRNESIDQTWIYYNHAMVSALPPFEEADTSSVYNGVVWKNTGGYPMLARWVSGFDCGYETQWWYCIKDTPFDIDILKSKDRYVVNKGKRNFSVEKIQPLKYKEELAQIEQKAFQAYPKEYRPSFHQDEFYKKLEKWGEKDITVLMAFEKITNKCCGYAMLKEYENYISFEKIKAIPEFEKKQVNAALVAGIMEYYQVRLEQGDILFGGERNILHKTAFQDYLERYFGFRKAYCTLHVKYRFGVGVAVRLLYPFRHLIGKSRRRILYKVNGVLSQEEIRRSFC